MSLRKYLKELKEEKEQGAVLVTAIILLTLMELLGFALITMSEVDSSVAGNLARNEEAYYAAEQGVYMGINWIVQNPTALPAGGGSQTINSAMFQGKSRDYTWGQDAWPYIKWEAELYNLGKAPPFPGKPLDLTIYWYRIISTGQSTGRITRKIHTEFALSPDLTTVGETGAGGAGSKLAFWK